MIQNFWKTWFSGLKRRWAIRLVISTQHWFCDCMGVQWNWPLAHVEMDNQC